MHLTFVSQLMDPFKDDKNEI